MLICVICGEKKKRDRPQKGNQAINLIICVNLCNLWWIKITGEKDLYAEIQSHAESVDITNIMQRYEI